MRINVKEKMRKDEKREGTKNDTSTSKTMKIIASRKNFIQKGT